jgi:hypothetical protein
MAKPASLTNINFDTGVIMERQRWIKMLMELGVLRESMLGGKNLVIYTQDGAIDTSLEELRDYE